MCWKSLKIDLENTCSSKNTAIFHAGSQKQNDLDKETLSARGTQIPDLYIKILIQSTRPVDSIGMNWQTTGAFHSYLQFI